MIKVLLVALLFATLAVGLAREIPETASGCSWNGTVYLPVGEYMHFTCDGQLAPLWATPMTNHLPMVWSTNGDYFQVLLLDYENFIRYAEGWSYSCINPNCGQVLNGPFASSFQLGTDENATLVFFCRNYIESCNLAYAFRLDSIWPTLAAPSNLSYTGWLQPHSCPHVPGSIQGDNLMFSPSFNGNPCESNPLQGPGIGAAFSSRGGATLVSAVGNVAGVWQKWIGGQYQTDWVGSFNFTAPPGSMSPPQMLADNSGALHAFFTAQNTVYYQYCNLLANCTTPTFFQGNVTSFGVSGAISPFGSLVVCFFQYSGAQAAPYCREQTNGQDTWTEAVVMPLLAPSPTSQFYALKEFSPVLAYNTNDDCLYAVQLGKDISQSNTTVNNPYYRIAFTRWCSASCHLSPSQPSCWSSIGYQPTLHISPMMWQGCLASQNLNYLQVSNTPDGTIRVATFDGSTLYIMDQPQSIWNGEWTTTQFSARNLAGSMPALGEVAPLSRYYVFATLSDGSLGYAFSSPTDASQWQASSLLSAGPPPSGLPLTGGQVVAPLEIYDLETLDEIDVTSVVLATDSAGYVHTFDPLRQSYLVVNFSNSSRIVQVDDQITVYWNISSDLADPCVVLLLQDFPGLVTYDGKFLTGTPAFNSSGYLAPCVPGTRTQAQTSGAFQFFAPVTWSHNVLRFLLYVPTSDSGYFMFSTASQSFSVITAGAPETGFEGATYFTIGFVKGVVTGGPDQCPMQTTGLYPQLQKLLSLTAADFKKVHYRSAIARLSEAMALLPPTLSCFSDSPALVLLNQILGDFSREITVFNDYEESFPVFGGLHDIYDDVKNLVTLWEAEQAEDAGERAGKIVKLFLELLQSDVGALAPVARSRSLAEPSRP